MKRTIDENRIRSHSEEKEQLDEKDEEIKALIEERRDISKEDKEQMKIVSKKIKTCTPSLTVDSHGTRDGFVALIKRWTI